MSTMTPYAAAPVFGPLVRSVVAIAGAFASMLAVIEEAQRLRLEAQQRYGLIDE